MDPFSVLGLASMGSSLLGGLFGDDEPTAMPTQQTGFAALPPEVQKAYLNLYLPEVLNQFQGKYYGMPMGQAPTGPFSSQELQNLQRYSNAVGGIFGGGTGVNPIGQVEPFSMPQMHALNSLGAGLGLNQMMGSAIPQQQSQSGLGRIFQAVEDLKPQPAPQNMYNAPRPEPVAGDAAQSPGNSNFGAGDLFNTQGAFQDFWSKTAPNIQPWESLNDYLMNKRKAELQGIKPEVFETMYRGPNSPGEQIKAPNPNMGPSFGEMPQANVPPQQPPVNPGMPNMGNQQSASAEKILPQSPITPVNAGNPNSFNGQYGLFNELPAFMSPFNQAVINRTLNQMNKQTDEARSGIMGRAARYGGLGAFGSSALGTQLAQLENANNDRSLDFLANANAANYNQALGLRRQTLADMLGAGGAMQQHGQTVLNALQPQLAAATPQGRLSQFSAGLGAFPQSGHTMQYTHQPNMFQKFGSAGMGLLGGLQGFGFI